MDVNTINNTSLFLGFKRPFGLLLYPQPNGYILAFLLSLYFTFNNKNNYIFIAGIIGLLFSFGYTGLLLFFTAFFIFSKLRYEDVKKAHMETVVPVTEQDFTNKKRFNNVEQYIRYRKSTQGDVPDLKFSKVQLNNIKNTNEVLNSKRAYNLLVEDNEMKKKNDLWWKNLKLLT